MKRPAVFFDRDNTLIACDEYIGDPAQVVLIPGAAEAVARAKRLGYATVIISNQSGVARGYFSEDAVHAVNARLDELLREADAEAIIDRHEFCPYHPDASIERYRRANSPLRKPSPGMLYSAAEALGLDLSRSWLIGDAPRDIEAGHAAGCRTILFVDASLKASPAASAERRVEPEMVCKSLAEAMDFIEQNTPKIAAEPQEASASSDDLESLAYPRRATQIEIGAEDDRAIDPPVPAEPSDPPAGETQASSGESDAMPFSVVVRPNGDDSVIAAERDDADQGGTRPTSDPLSVSSREKATTSPHADEDAAGESDRRESEAEQTASASSSNALPPRRPWLEAAAEARRASSSASTGAAGSGNTGGGKLETIAADILHELRRNREQPQSDFSVSKLLGGVVQMIVLFVLFIAYFNRGDVPTLQSLLLLALTLQAMTIALLIMGKQK